MTFSIHPVPDDVPSIALSAHLLDALVRYCTASPEEELCGFLAGEVASGHPNRVVFVPNLSPTPAVAYSMDHADLMNYAQAMETTGLHTYAAFHSHVSAGPWPSVRDIEHAAPDVPYQIIVGQGGLVAAYLGDFTPAPIVVVSDHHHCARCQACMTLDHYAPLTDYYLCPRELS